MSFSLLSPLYHFLGLLRHYVFIERKDLTSVKAAGFHSWSWENYVVGMGEIEGAVSSKGLTLVVPAWRVVPDILRLLVVRELTNNPTCQPLAQLLRGTLL